MNELKFRVWDVENKRFVDDVSICGMRNKNNCFSVCLGERYEIIRSTGLVDKNDVEIFEGDIIESYFENQSAYYKDVIVWDEEEAGFFLADVRDRKEINAIGEYGLFGNSVVIGNIYENSKMVKWGK